MKQITDKEIEQRFYDKSDCYADATDNIIPVQAMTLDAAVDLAKWMQEQLQPDWVSVSERLPEIGHYVQAAIPGGVLLYSCVLKKNNTWYGYGYAQPETRITHWKPLPEGPKP